MVDRVECSTEIDIYTIDLIIPCCEVNLGPVKELHLPLSGMQLTETLLRGVKQSILLAQPVQSVS